MSTPGFRFKDGKLYIFGEDEEVMVIESWPELRAVRKRADERAWKEFAPVFRLVHPYRRAKVPVKPKVPVEQLELALAASSGKPFAPPSLAEQRKRAFDGFRFSLPKEVAKRVERFPGRQWRLLKLFREREQTLELAQQNAALTFCLAHAALFRDLSDGGGAMALAATVSQSRQREIAGWLGFPATEGAAKILSRVQPEAAHPQSLLRLRAALRDEAATRVLSHAPRINAGVLGLVADAELRHAATPKLVAEVASSAAEKYRAATAGMLADLLAMKQQLARRNVPPSFSSIARLREIHGELSAEFCQLCRDDERATRFPRPPLPGTPDIVPLRTPLELVNEGASQTNCVASYIPRVAAGEVYIYRVQRPERATLSIVPSPDGAWEIDQLLLAANRPVGAATDYLVRAWLDRFSFAA